MKRANVTWLLVFKCVTLPENSLMKHLFPFKTHKMWRKLKSPNLRMRQCMKNFQFQQGRCSSSHSSLREEYCCISDQQMIMMIFGLILEGQNCGSVPQDPLGSPNFSLQRPMTECGSIYCSSPENWVKQGIRQATAMKRKKGNTQQKLSFKLSQ